MRCLILAFDGLEYDLVEKFNLKNIKQKEYGKVKIPKECYTSVRSAHFKEPVLEPYTPLVWSAFLTGKLVGEYIFTDFYVWENSVLNKLRRLSTKIGLNRIEGKAKILELLGFKRKKASTLKDYVRVSTIFDLAENSICINVPMISEDWKIRLGYNPSAFPDFNDFIKTVLKAATRKFNFVKSQTFEKLISKKYWELFMMYTKFLDIYGELCFLDEKLFDVYSRVDSFVKQVKSQVDERECLVLIISDHGIERMGKTRFGKHSNYAFYSTNLRLGLNNPDMRDFYSLIEKMLRK